MNSYRRAATTSYDEQEIVNESPLARVARVYEMALYEVGRSRAALAADDRTAKGVAINRAARCISLLQTSLDMKLGGEVALNLDRIYGYLLRRLSHGHLKSDDGALTEVAQHLAALGAAWRQVANQPQAEQEPVALAGAAR